MGRGRGGLVEAPHNIIYEEVPSNRVRLSIQDRLFQVVFFLSTFDI